MKIRVDRRGQAYCAHLEPLEGVYVGAAGPDPAAALHQASRLLATAIERPEVQAVLPPGTLVAVKLLRGATAALRRGELRGYLERLPAGAARTVSRTLKRLVSW